VRVHVGEYAGFPDGSSPGRVSQHPRAMEWLLDLDEGVAGDCMITRRPNNQCRRQRNGDS